MSTASSQGAVLDGKCRVRVYRHEPYAASIMTPASAAEAMFVCFHQRAPRSPASSYATSSPARSLLEAALPSAPVLAQPPPPRHDRAVSRVSPLPQFHPAQTPVWVAFKYGRKPFLTSFPVSIGEMVIVEGDRGIDLGLVDDACTAPMSGAMTPILRRATSEDTAQHLNRTTKEREALQTMRSLAAQVHCPAHVEDAMFQLDSKKITVIISRTSRSFVDFRRLQRALFDVFRCRIWFAYLDEIHETMSTDVTRPPRRASRRCSAVGEAGEKSACQAASCAAIA
ncbi:PSP1 C-terminal conserved region containing protein [Novymonas esmeraldas]|uniref:PSP1 C-terminal conserved region containing protein n=1 Tax=Novymonas esmeraldas TaxID=1808958 RepID=A0AAW0F6L3_9TRYP